MCEHVLFVHYVYVHLRPRWGQPFLAWGSPAVLRSKYFLRNTEAPVQCCYEYCYLLSCLMVAVSVRSHA